MQGCTKEHGSGLQSGEQEPLKQAGVGVGVAESTLPQDETLERAAKAHHETPWCGRRQAARQCAHRRRRLAGRLCRSRSLACPGPSWQRRPVTSALGGGSHAPRRFVRPSSGVRSQACRTARRGAVCSRAAFYHFSGGISEEESTTMAAGKGVQESTPAYLGGLLDAGEGNMVTLAAGETRLVAHTAVLVTGSPVFAAMFRHNMEESGSGLVDIRDVDGPVLRELLTFMYTFHAPQLASMAAQLLVAADKYGVLSLKAQCEQQLATALAVDNAAATAVLAVRHCCPGLRLTTISYIKGRTHEVMATQGWADAVRTQPEDVIEVSKLLAETPESSVPATADCRPTSTSHGTQPLSDCGRTPTAAARHTPPPPDDSAVSRLRLLSEAERGRRLIEAAKEGVVEQLCRLLAAGADVGVRDRAWYSRTALHWAAVWGHVGAASCLIGASVEVDARGSRQTTPLHFAAANGHTALVQVLLDASADPNGRDDLGLTPLHLAARWGQTGVAVELLQAGADSVARDGGGRTPLDLAMQNNEQQLVEMLQQR
ncbi:ankyrin-3-like [Schistocerca piceifrons]|uniref:ankyrin-3-like n=1 Tax=Schistocerca piceifrons TaxID=274613 RepID=UPI001F5E3E72|nr:ankyrin-3-like [Schistocerca piceifrons]